MNVGKSSSLLMPSLLVSICNSVILWLTLSFESTCQFFHVIEVSLVVSCSHLFSFVLICFPVSGGLLVGLVVLALLAFRCPQRLLRRARVRHPGLMRLVVSPFWSFLHGVFIWFHGAIWCLWLLVFHVSLFSSSQVLKMWPHWNRKFARFRCQVSFIEPSKTVEQTAQACHIVLQKVFEGLSLLLWFPTELLEYKASWP